MKGLFQCPPQGRDDRYTAKPFKKSAFIRARLRHLRAIGYTAQLPEVFVFTT